MPFSGLSAWCHFLVCFLRAISFSKSARSFDASQKLSRSGFNPWGATKLVGLETHYLCCCLHILKVHFIVAFQGLL